MNRISHFLYTVLPNVPTSKKHGGNRLSEKFFIGMFGNGFTAKRSLIEIKEFKIEIYERCNNVLRKRTKKRR